MKNTLIILLFLLSSTSIAGNNKADKTKEAKAREWIKNQPLEFIENKGQFMRTDGKTADEVLFKTSFGNCDIYITVKGLSYVFVKYEEDGSQKTEDRGDENVLHKQKFGEREEENKKVSYYRLDMNLEGANISKSNIIKENESKQGHYNYFYAHCPEGIYDVKGYGKITIKNVYKGIDWVIYTNSNSKEHPLKYDFVVHPEADYKDIKIKFLNAQSTSLLDKDTKLKIETIAGNIEEGNLYSYQTNSNNEISSKYIIDKDSIISFEIKDYDTTKVLVIDPLVWATYYGGSKYDDFNSICVDQQDNIYITGSTSSTNFPVQQLTGAYLQTNHSGYWDIIILKFNSQGVRIWATYYGGTNNDYARSICSDSQSNIYINGESISSDFPTQQLVGAYWQPILNSNAADLYILKFNNQGVRIWATYYGGIGEEGNSSYSYLSHKTICVDTYDNLFVTGVTRSSNFPIQQLNGAYWQGNYAGGNSIGGDIFILKFNNQGVRQWATFYGGSGDEIGNSIILDNQNNIYITGHTESLDFPLQQSAGAYMQNNNGGGSDAFIIKFNEKGIREWATYYGGNNSDESFSLCNDSKGNIYMVGYTVSNDFPLQQHIGAYYQSTIAGGMPDSYIVKFNKLGIRQWATYYGGSALDMALSVCNDKVDNIYITGYTYSPNLPLQQVVGEYWQISNYGGCNSFMLKFNYKCVRQWATFYGTNGYESGTDIAVDNQNDAYFVGHIGYSGAYTVDYGNGAYYDNSWHGDNDSFILKISFPCNNKKTVLLNSVRNNLCYNDLVNLTLTAIGGEGDTLKWYLDDCGQNYIGMNTPLIISSPTQTTTYYARWESDCGVSECDSITIFVNDCEVKLELPNIITPNNDGSNDVFLPIISNNINKLNTQIFNRWGSLIYETDKLNIEWDGKHYGKPVADGVYFWIVNYIDTNGKEGMMKGSVTVIK